jgi:hypothetical protein
MMLLLLLEGQEVSVCTVPTPSARLPRAENTPRRPCALPHPSTFAPGRPRYRLHPAMAALHATALGSAVGWGAVAERRPGHVRGTGSPSSRTGGHHGRTYCVGSGSGARVTQRRGKSVATATRWNATAAGDGTQGRGTHAPGVMKGGGGDVAGRHAVSLEP